MNRSLESRSTWMKGHAARAAASHDMSHALSPAMSMPVSYIAASDRGQSPGRCAPLFPRHFTRRTRKRTTSFTAARCPLRLPARSYHCAFPLRKAHPTPACRASRPSRSLCPLPVRTCQLRASTRARRCSLGTHGETNQLSARSVPPTTTSLVSLPRFCPCRRSSWNRTTPCG